MLHSRVRVLHSSGVIGGSGGFGEHGSQRGSQQVGDGDRGKGGESSMLQHTRGGGGSTRSRKAAAACSQPVHHPAGATHPS